MKFMNGDEYSGQWDKDHFHGSGRYIFSSKQVLQGLFHFGRYEGNDLISNKIINAQPQSQGISNGFYYSSQKGT